MARSSIDWYFKEPRLLMTAGGRFMVRAVSNLASSVLFVSAFIFSLSDVRWLQSLGLLLALFLLDRIFHIGRGEKSLAKILPGRRNVAEYLAPQTFRSLESAYELTHSSKANLLLILVGNLARRGDVRKSLARLDVSEKDFFARLAEYTENSRHEERAMNIDEEVVFIVVEAAKEAQILEQHSVEPKDLFAAILRTKDPAILKLMGAFNISEGDLENALLADRFARRFFVPFHLPHLFHESRRERHRVMNRAWTARPTPFLDAVSTDLTDAARAGSAGLLVGHEKEYEILIDILAKGGDANALLIGEPGSGKDAIVEHLAYEIIKDRVPPPLFDRRLVSLSLGDLVSGSDEGKLAERLTHIVREITQAGNIILVIPEIHNLVKSGGKLSLSAADILIPAIKNAGFSVIGTTYPREYKQFIDPVSDFVSAFGVVRVNELSESDSVRFLILRSVLMERNYRIPVSFKAIKGAVQLAHKYIRDKLLPASAEEVLEEALADAREKRKDVITPDDVVAIIERRVNVPIHRVQAFEADQLLRLESVIHNRYIDQDEAVGAVSRAIREYRSGLTRKGGPIATFLFVGPTGVGKTELAKILTEIQFGDQKLMQRFDMSEYQDKSSFFRFIGSPDGNVRGALTDAISEKPYSLILLDEFEKAYPDILNLFLQVFDDGRLTDNIGKVVDFQNTIIIATSNAHSEFIKEEIEKGTPMNSIAEQIKRKLTTYFKPELLNRFSDIIVFKPLSKADMAAVSKIALNDLAATLRENQGIELQYDQSVIEEIARLGYDPVFGARPLRKVISEKLRSILAEKILKNEIVRGSTIRVALESGRFIFTNV